MKAYQYEIISINEKERWIYLQADIWDDEEPDSFVYLLKKIRDGLNGKIIDKGLAKIEVREVLKGQQRCYPFNYCKEYGKLIVGRWSLEVF